VVALIVFTGGSLLRERAWFSPFAQFAAAVPDSGSTQGIGPEENPVPALAPVTRQILEATPTSMLLDEGTVEPMAAPTEAPTQQPELPDRKTTPTLEPTATVLLEPADTATAEPPVVPADQSSSGPSQLPVAGAAPVRVVAPAIDLDQPVITVGWHQEVINDKLVSVWDVAQYAVGWHKNSKYPGQGGNVVLAGHNNIYGEVFKRLEDLNVGDLITVYADGHAYDYAVESTIIVKEEGATPEEKASNARWIGQFPDERLTLVACYPYTGNSHRILIIARPRFECSP